MITRTLGPYRIEEQVGEGGMGAVYRATDLMLGRGVALKILRPELAHDPDLVERFRQEARSLARVAHPNVAALYGLFSHEDALFMAMEFVQGEAADARLRRAGRLVWTEACALVLGVLRGLDCAHRHGVVHRDLKPANLLISAAGAVKITDFGIARVLGSARHTRAGAIIGTLAYMAPEQVRGEAGDERTDIYAAGMVLYELLTGEVAFARTSEFDMMKDVIEAAVRPPRERAPDAPTWLEEVVVKALAKDPEDRFQSAGEMMAAIEARAPIVEAGDPQATRVVKGVAAHQTRLANQDPGPTIIAAPPVPAASRRPGWRLAAAAAGVVIIGMCGGWAALRPAVVRTTAPVVVAAMADASQPISSSVVTEPVPGRLPPTVPVGEAPALKPPSPARRHESKQGPALPPASWPAPVAGPPLDVPPAHTVGRAGTLHPSLVEPLVFDRVTLVQNTGGKTAEVDAALSLTADRLVLTLEGGGTVLRSLLYESMTSVVYSRGQRPAMDTLKGRLAAGMFATRSLFGREVQHWLTIEGGREPMVLRLDKRNCQAIVAALEARGGRKVSGTR